MKKTLRGVHAFVFALAVIAPLALSAGPWEPLFNGRDLSGWKQVNGTAPYTVVDGAIVGTTVPGSPNSFLATEKLYGDFILELEVMQDAPSNSGIQFRSECRASDGRVHGYQMEIDPTPRAWTGGIYDEARRGWFYTGSMNPAARDLYKLNQWNRVRIEAIGPSIRTWINGEPVAHVIDDMNARGFIALQIHSISKKKPEEAGRRVFWRNIRIQTTDLKPSPADSLFIRNTIVNNLAGAERAQGWKLLWDGRTTAGWRGAGKKAFPEKGWRIENGELVVQKSDGRESQNGGDIVTEAEYAAFEVALEFKLTKGANSGIKYYVTEKYVTKGSAIGLEFQLLDDANHPDAKLGAAGNRQLGSLYDLIPINRMPGSLGVKPRLGEWQHARIISRADGTVEHWLNGIKVVEYTRGSPLFMALVERSKYNKHEGFGLAKSGRILLQDHGDEVRFRSIKLREL
ncbi:3-keto-disaccharide hydrolase [Ereboglobus luteus]|uniref:3-keto-alpha-glucoside-1,2-lyase/3-keto-2-hydroxy-glucal hydratase domain-containing protein n=1 Tax=Ereboglobus luteus TaxID=1796921 RepID=A0A2U8E1W8_9BACT|nr:DUF1080 domain-containing protein [Ereboglobus luteus]AWI08831.1 hypothetical protein CKA38_05810 [Ereboglobus luteus]